MNGKIGTKKSSGILTAVIIIAVSILITLSAATAAHAASEIAKLPAKEKTVAKNIAARITGKNKKTYVTPQITKSQTLKIERAINHDYFLYGYNPYLLTYAYLGSTKKTALEIRYSDFYNENMRMNSLLESMANKAIKASVKSGMSVTQKIYAINKYICDHFSYHSVNQANTYAYMRKWKGDCSSYALLFHACMVRLKIRSRPVVGTTLYGEPHTWSGVKIGGKWYHIDVCWNDGSGNYTEYWLSRSVLRRHVYSYHVEKMLPSYYADEKFLGIR